MYYEVLKGNEYKEESRAFLYGFHYGTGSTLHGKQ